MPTKREREYYRMGFLDGRNEEVKASNVRASRRYKTELETYRTEAGNVLTRVKPKRKLSAWNKYVKANSKKPRFRYRSGKLNLKKMAVAFRKTPAGKKKRR
jgi:hypothetical protein